MGAGTEFDELGHAFNLMASQLEQTEDTRRRLLSGLAHELRTPIATLTVYCEGLRDGVTTWNAETERVMTEQTERLARLAADLDEVSRAEEGRLALELSPTPVRELIWSAAQAKREAFARQGVELDVRADAAPDVNVAADPRRVGQVLDNLLANALRHTPPGGSVRLFARAVHDAVEIVVADTGDGMSTGSAATRVRAVLPWRHRAGPGAGWLRPRADDQPRHRRCAPGQPRGLQPRSRPGVDVHPRPPPALTATPLPVEWPGTQILPPATKD